MRKGLNEAYEMYEQQRHVDEHLSEPLPEHRVLSIEVYDEFVEANLHKHEWTCTSDMPSVHRPYIVRAVFECKGCTDIAVREIDTFDSIYRR